MPWDTSESSGGLLSHFIGTVQSSKWVTNTASAFPAPREVWTVSVDDVLQENYTGTTPDTLPVTLSCGKGWVEDEDGATVEHEDGNETFNSQSLIGKLINLIIGKTANYGANAYLLDGGTPPEFDMTGVAKYMEEQGFDDPRKAHIWEGLTFEFRGYGFDYAQRERPRGVGPDTSQMFTNPLPVRFIGAEAPRPKTSKKATKTDNSAGSAEASPSTDPQTWLAAGAEQDVADTLVTLAGSSSSHTQFAKQALAIPEVKGNPALVEAVMAAG